MRTFQRGESVSILDLTLATESMVCAVTGWTVRDEETLSLHNYIEFNLTLNRRVFKEDQKFREVLQKGKLIDLMRRELEGNGTDMEMDLRFLVSSIKEVQDRTTCRVREREGGSNIYWWLEEIQKQTKGSLRARRAYTRFRRHGLRWEEEEENLRTAYREERRVLKSMIRRSKARHWRDLCGELNQDTCGEGFKIVMRGLKQMASCR